MYREIHPRRKPKKGPIEQATRKGLMASMAGGLKRAGTSFEKGRKWAARNINADIGPSDFGGDVGFDVSADDLMFGDPFGGSSKRHRSKKRHHKKRSR